MAHVMALGLFLSYFFHSVGLSLKKVISSVPVNMIFCIMTHVTTLGLFLSYLFTLLTRVLRNVQLESYLICSSKYDILPIDIRPGG
jgi:hypothetical protein